MANQPKRGRGRPPRPMPEQIPDTPENVARALLSTPPKKHEDWEYLRLRPSLRKAVRRGYQRRNRRGIVP